MIAMIVDEKLPIHRSHSNCLTLDLCQVDLTQPTSGNFSMPPSSRSTSPITAHVPHKTRKAILSSEFVVFDSLLPENSSLVDHDLPGISIQFEGKHVNIPTPSRKKKMHVNMIDWWLSMFTVFCTVLLTSFPPRGR